MAKQGTLFDFDSRTIARNLVAALHKLSVLEGEGIATPYVEVATALDRLLDVVIADVSATRLGADKLVREMRAEAAEDELMAIMCLCCGLPAVRREGVMSLAQMRRGLRVLERMGYEIADLAHKPEYVESLNMTSPGFVDWLRSENVTTNG